MVVHVDWEFWELNVVDIWSFELQVSEEIPEMLDFDILGVPDRPHQYYPP